MLSNEALTAVVNNACHIIFSNEGGYGSVNKNDNGALSVGKVQWHAGRALALCKTVIEKAAQAQSILGVTLYTEIKNAASDAWNKRVVTADEASGLSKLLSTEEGKAAQDALAAEDVKTYILKGESCGLTDGGALIYFADFANQYGAASSLLKKITDTALKGAGDVQAMFDATKAATSDYLSRREKVYKAVLALDPKAGAKAAANTQAQAVANAAAEITANNAVADGIIGDKAYWLSVMQGATVPSKENVKKLLDNIHEKLKGH